LGRKSRLKNELPMIALAGYTNAGKSTLFNTLTQAEVFADEQSSVYPFLIAFHLDLEDQYHLFGAQGASSLSLIV
jgi:deoxyadenosine/deoxycytidine kinase